MDEAFEFAVDVIPQGDLQCRHIDVAGLHYACRIDIIDQGEEEMLQRGVFVPPLVGEGERLMQGFFEIPGKGRQRVLTSFP